MTFKIGLTGSIGMGKSATAQIFRDLGVPVWDADACVHRLYAQGGAAVDPMGAAFPDAISDGAVDREKLKQIIAGDLFALKRIEAIVHPLVAADRAEFIAHSDGIVVLDIPLLFETGSAAQMDAVVVVTIDAKTQRQRVLDRGTMSEEQFETILAKQVPDSEKRAQADYIVITDTPEHARAQVEALLADIRDKHDA